jgi:single-stranded-DNA-specific exonuclease
MEGLTLRDSDGGNAYTLARLFNITEIGARILDARGLNDSHGTGAFLFPRLSVLHSPFYINNMPHAVHRLRTAIERKEKIGLFSDSDLDGLTALAISSQFLEGAGVTVICRYPVGEENYGLTTGAVDEFFAAGIALLITLDCGIRDVDEIACAKSKGIDCIICDHHEQGPDLPDAIVIDPKVGSTYPFRDLAGASVAMKLCHALAVSYLPMYDRSYAIAVCDDETGRAEIRIVKNGVVTNSFHADDHSRREESPDIHTLFTYNMREIPPWFEKWSDRTEPFENLIASAGHIVLPGARETLLRALSLPPHYPASLLDLAGEFFFDISFNRPGKIRSLLCRWLPLAAIGTVADVVPLVGENRTIVAHGLSLCGSSDSVPIRLLAAECPDMDATAVAWKIAPLLNTPGRLGKTELTASFLTCCDEQYAGELFRNIKKLNEERRRLMKERMEACMSEIDHGGHSLTRNFTYIRLLDIGDGFTGLLAGRIAEKTGKPAIVVSDISGKDALKGSGRAPEGIAFLSYIEPFAGEFMRFGGHTHAFGFSVSPDTVDKLMEKIDRNMDGVTAASRTATADIEVTSPHTLMNFFRKDYDRFAPFGHGNEEPLFFTQKLGIGNYAPFGNDGKHGKYILAGGIHAIGWGIAKEMEKLADGELNILYRLEEDRYNGKMRIVLERLEKASQLQD